MKHDVAKQGRTHMVVEGPKVVIGSAFNAIDVSASYGAHWTVPAVANSTVHVPCVERLEGLEQGHETSRQCRLAHISCSWQMVEGSAE